MKIFYMISFICLLSCRILSYIKYNVKVVFIMLPSRNLCCFQPLSSFVKFVFLALFLWLFSLFYLSIAALHTFFIIKLLHFYYIFILFFKNHFLFFGIFLFYFSYLLAFSKLFSFSIFPFFVFLKKSFFYFLFFTLCFPYFSLRYQYHL